MVTKKATTRKATTKKATTKKATTKKATTKKATTKKAAAKHSDDCGCCRTCNGPGPEIVGQMLERLEALDAFQSMFAQLTYGWRTGEWSTKAGRLMLRLEDPKDESKYVDVYVSPE